MPKRAWLSVALLATACVGTGELTVDLQTDFEPGVQFDSVAVSIDDGEVTSIPVARFDDFSELAHLQHYEGVPYGRHAVEADLLLDGGLVSPGSLVVRTHGNTLAPVIVQRECGAMTCAPNQRCYASMCFDPECDPSQADAGCVASECSATRACAPVTGPCVDVVCEYGGCLHLPHEERCTDTAHHCDTATGECRLLTRPGRPTVTLSNVSSSGLTATWSPGVEVASYDVECSRSSTFPMDMTTIQMSTTDPTVTTDFSPLMPRTDYWVHVRAVGLNGLTGDWSDSVMTTTTATPPPAAPTGVTIAASCGATYRLCSDPYWIQAPTDCPHTYYAQGAASGSCAAPSIIQYSFSAQYYNTSRPPTPSTAWDTHSIGYMPNPTSGYGCRFTVRAHCYDASTGLTSAEVSDTASVFDNGRLPCFHG